MAKKGLLVFTILLILFSGCGRKIERNRDYLSISMSSDPVILNPILSVDSASSEITDLVYNGLIKINPNLEVVPDLADTWIIKDKGLTYVFKLKKGVKWHDGYPFTAEDVKFTYDKIMDPATQTVRREMFAPFESFEVLDTYTLIAKLKEPYAPAILSFGMGVIPKHIFEKLNINDNEYNNRPIGTGPYKFVEWKKGRYVRLISNPDYYEHKPKIDTIVFEIIPEEAVSLMKLESGDIDIASIQPQEVERIKKNKNINVFITDQLAYTYIAFNFKREKFRDVRIRRALTYLIDRQSLVDYILQGYGEVAYSPIPPVSWAHNPNVVKYEFAPEKGLELLAQAGYNQRNKDGQLINKQGEVFKFTIITNQGNDIRKQVAEYIQAQLRQYGIDMEIRLIEWSSFIKKYIEPRDFEAVLLGWSLGVDPDQFGIWHSTQQTRGFNFISYENKEVDRLLEEGRKETNIDKRKKIYYRFQELIAEDVPYIFLYYPKGITGINKRVKVVKPSRFSLMYYLIDWELTR